jgi:hypothetical protein
MWLLCSVINVFTAVYSKSPDNVIVRLPKLVFLVEFSVSTIIPAAMVAINLVAKGTYRTFSVYVILCGPPSRTLYYYTVCLPLEIIVVTESVLTLLIIVRLRKVEVVYVCLFNSDKRRYRKTGGGKTGGLDELPDGRT